MRPLKEIEQDFRDTFKNIQPRQSKTPLAVLIVEARLDHFTRNDLPDFQGRSMDFRRWYSDLLDSVHLNERQERDRFASSLRFAIGNELRKQLDDEQLQQAGLEKSSPRDRGYQSYHRIATPHNISRNGLADDAEVSEMVELVSNTLNSTKDMRLRKAFLDSLRNLQ